jgi:phage gpG-like protein
VRYVKERKLSGQVLKNRTGTLRRKINQVVTESPDSIMASVGVKLSYAAIHEYGFDGVESVREYTRRTAKGIAVVPAHERHVHMPERSYLRSSLRENAASIRDSLAKAVVEALQ